MPTSAAGMARLARLQGCMEAGMSIARVSQPVRRAVVSTAEAAAGPRLLGAFEGFQAVKHEAVLPPSGAAHAAAAAMSAVA